MQRHRQYDGGPNELRLNPFGILAILIAGRIGSTGAALLLLDAGLYRCFSSRDPSGGGIGAVIRPCIEGNRRTWGNLANSVDDDFQ